MKTFKSFIVEGRPSQRHPLEGHDYHRKTDAELVYIAKDAHKAAEAMKGHNTQAENKYRDQANDSATVRYYRQKNGMPNWYKKKYGHMKEGRCWPGHKPVPGKKPYSPGSCVKEEETLDEMDKSQPSSSRGAEGVPTGKKATPEKTDKVTRDALKVLQKSYKDKKVKEEIELEEAIPKSTGHALIHSSSRKIVAKGNKAEMMKKMKELNAKEKNSHHLGMTNRGKVGDTFGEEVELDEVAAWQRKEGKNPEGGLNQKGVESYRRENPGSKLQTAVTTEPSKLKPGSKSAKRRLSFCRRMKGMKEKLTSAETARDPDSRINKSLRKWNC
jgi:hypothetical protein